ncbi:hypothetical protein JCM11491_002968 [Sporobolomyces phaffii]
MGAEDEGAGGKAEEAAKDRASEDDSDRGFRIDDIPEPEARAGNEEDRVRAPVFVPEGEENGLPTTATDGMDGEERAKGIVRAYATGLKGIWSTSIRRRRADGGAVEPEAEKENHEIIGEGSGERDQPKDGHEEVTSAALSNAGILTALMALQQQEAELAGSLPNSTASTPAPSTPSSPTPSDGDAHHYPPLEELSDEEEEREKFIAKLRAKRATKNAMHATSAAVSNKGKSAASAGFHFATGGHFRGGGHDRGRNFSASNRAHSSSTLASLVEESPSRSRASSPDDGSSSRALSPHRPYARSLQEKSDPTPHRSRSATSLAAHHRSHSATSLAPTLSRERTRPSSTSLHKFVSRSSSPSPPPSPGLYVPYQARFTTELSKRVRKLGDRLGLELETERTRPSAAQSGGGVFAGLITSTAGLAGVATPSGSSLAPLPTRAGFHVTRFNEMERGESASSNRKLSPARSPPDGATLAAPSHSPPLERSTPSSRSPYFSQPQTRAASRMSLHEMVKEEEERDLEGTDSDLRRSNSVGTFQLPPVVAKPPNASTSGMSAVEALSQRRARRKRAMFSLQPSTVDDEHRKTSPVSPISPLGPLSSPLNPNPTRSRTSTISPTTANFRFFGPRTPKSPNSLTPRKDYFAGSPTPAQLEKERAEQRAERKAREKAEREAKEREGDLREWEREKRRRKKQRLKELKARRVFITAHVANLLERQDFILKLARALMMFGAPSHRLEAQLQATGRVLELPNCHCVYLPGVMLINFGDPATCTSDIKFLKQPAGLDFGKLRTAFWVYSKVVRDKMKVTEASARLDELMVAPPKYALWKSVIIGGIASAAIIPSAFYGSFIDVLAVIPLGGLLVVVQVLLARNDLYSSLFEIAIACINCIIAGGLAYSNQFCFYSVAAGSIVLILPGFIVLSGSLELANRSIISGAVRVTYSILYSLFLGFGLSLGSEIYTRGANETIRNSTDYTCRALRENAPWYRATIPQWYYFLTIPTFLLCMALKNGQPLFRRDTLAMVVIGGAGFSANFFSGRAFPDAPATVSAFGAFVVGILGNLWSKATRESAFVVMIVGIFVQLPSGLANGGLLASAIQGSAGNTNAFSSSVNAAAGIVRTVVGMAVGLFTSAALINLLSRRGVRRGDNLATF